jgi:hypothetical protein
MEIRYRGLQGAQEASSDKHAQKGSTNLFGFFAVAKSDVEQS